MLGAIPDNATVFNNVQEDTSRSFVTGYGDLTLGKEGDPSELINAKSNTKTGALDLTTGVDGTGQKGAVNMLEWTKTGASQGNVQDVEWNVTVGGNTNNIAAAEFDNFQFVKPTAATKGDNTFFAGSQIDYQKGGELDFWNDNIGPVDPQNGCHTGQWQATGIYVPKLTSGDSYTVNSRMERTTDAAGNPMVEYLGYSFTNETTGQTQTYNFKPGEFEYSASTRVGYNSDQSGANVQLDTKPEPKGSATPMGSLTEDINWERIAQWNS